VREDVCFSEMTLLEKAGSVLKSEVLMKIVQNVSKEGFKM